MADEPTEELPEVEIDAPEDEQVEQQQQHEEVGDDEYVIEIEGEDESEAEPESAPIRRIREELKEEKRRRAELERQLAPKPVELGAKPTLESCEYDEDRFERELSDYHERKNAADKQTAEQARATEAANERIRQRDANYYAKAQSLQARARIKPEVYRESEAAVQRDLLSGPDGEHLKALILGYTDDPAVVIQALGSRADLRDKFAAIDDPITRFLAIRDFSREKIKMKRNAAPPPEERVSGSASAARSSSNKEGDRLLAEAQRTGNMDKYRAWRKSQKAA